MQFTSVSSQDHLLSYILAYKLHDQEGYAKLVRARICIAPIKSVQHPIHALRVSYRIAVNGVHQWRYDRHPWPAFPAESWLRMP